jgi:hypothetical protein
MVHKYVGRMRSMAGETGEITRAVVHKVSESVETGEEHPFRAAVHWLRGGMSSVFLQDANSLIIKPGDLCTILEHIMKCFPWIERITSYARAQTISRMKQEDLNAMRQVGLNRIHIGLESGSDTVLQLMKKGVTKQQHIAAGLRVREAGMELSEYVMPGLGGRQYSREHALETADALNRIDPDFIRLRTLAVPDSVPLHDMQQSGEFEKCTEVETVREILLLLENLQGIFSRVRSDHILNLFQEVDGKFPEDREAMLGVMRSFLDMTPEEQTLFQVGRRMGLLSALQDLQVPKLRQQCENVCRQMNITSENVDAALDKMVKRFI